jgi:predicted phage terminase large subunit-like protein
MLLNEEELNEIINNRGLRKKMAQEDHLWFFHIYFSHYTQYPTAQFQKDFFNATHDESKNPLVVMAFRGSAKSTILSLSYVIWSVLGKQNKKYVVLLGQTQRQARQHLANIKTELENNKLLQEDLGPFKEQTDEWGSHSLVLPWYDARISAASMEQPIRGMRHKQYRPDLIICDDIEDMATVKTKEGRDKIFNWITSEVIPAGDMNTRFVFVGNLLHEDSFLVRTKNKIAEGEMDGHYMEVPLIKDGRIMWPGKFTSMEDIKKLENKVNDKIAWEREYMLNIISTAERVIHPEWITYYDEVPPTEKNKDFRLACMGVDLAVSKKESSDYTAIVSALVYGYEDKVKIYILPNPINAKMTHNENLNAIKANFEAIHGFDHRGKIYIEDVAYQKSVIQELDRFNYPAEEVKVHGQDKRARLMTVSHLVQNSTVLFPRKGVEDLICQLVNFGAEKHDDLADAFSILCSKIIQKDHKKRYIPFFIPGDDGTLEDFSIQVNYG